MDSTFEISGYMTIDTDRMKLTNYVYDVGYLTWDIKSHDLYSEDGLSVRGVATLSWKDLTSTVVITRYAVIHNLPSKERVVQVIKSGNLRPNKAQIRVMKKKNIHKLNHLIR